MTLHAWLANLTSLESFMVWYCSVCELHKSNSKKKEKKKNSCGAYLTPFPCTNLHDILVRGVIC